MCITNFNLTNKKGSSCIRNECKRYEGTLGENPTCRAKAAMSPVIMGMLKPQLYLHSTSQRDTTCTSQSGEFLLLFHPVKENTCYAWHP